MAKSSRATRTKVNRSNLRARVFRPIEDERTRRLSEKLLDLASQAKPENPEAMDVDGESKKQHTSTHTNLVNEEDIDMDAHEAGDRSKTALKKARANKKDRIEKRRKRKPTNQMTFAKLTSVKKGGSRKKVSKR